MQYYWLRHPVAGWELHPLKSQHLFTAHNRSDPKETGILRREYSAASSVSALTPPLRYAANHLTSMLSSSSLSFHFSELRSDPTIDFITLAPKKLILTRRASEGSASEPSLARRVSMCKDAKLSCRGNIRNKDSCPTAAGKTGEKLRLLGHLHRSRRALKRRDHARKGVGSNGGTP